MGQSRRSSEGQGERWLMGGVRRREWGQALWRVIGAHLRALILASDPQEGGSAAAATAFGVAELKYDHILLLAQVDVAFEPYLRGYGDHMQSCGNHVIAIWQSRGNHVVIAW